MNTSCKSTGNFSAWECFGAMMTCVRWRWPRAALAALTKTLAAMLVAMFTLTLPAYAAESGVSQAYRLGAGDEISIRVYGEPDMDVKTRLGDQGVINYPFLGELKVSGLTVGELEQLITRGLKGAYLVDPAVTVDIAEYRPFFVNGDVARPGAIPYQPGVTLRKAIAMAGGFTERANRSGADIISGAEPGQKPRRATMDEFIQPGDIVTIKPSFF
jgi:polysaccharide export outer membrane protein